MHNLRKNLNIETSTDNVEMCAKHCKVNGREKIRREEREVRLVPIHLLASANRLQMCGASSGP
jgi:hypothetical protein